MPDFLQLAAPGLLALVIPAAILAGHRRPAGPVVITSGGACAAFAVFWLVLGGMYALNGETSAAHALVSVVVFFAGVLLLLAGWTLAVGAAAQAHRYRWVALLAATGSLTVAVVYYTTSHPDLCLVTSPPSPYSYPPSCAQSDPLRQLLVAVGYLAGPVAAMVFSLRGSVLHGQALPQGAGISPLAVAEADGEPDVWVERL